MGEESTEFQRKLAKALRAGVDKGLIKSEFKVYKGKGVS